MRWSEIYESLSLPYEYVWDYQKPDYWHATFFAGEEKYFITADATCEGFPDPDDPTQDAKWFDLAFGITRNGLAGSSVIGSGGRVFRIFATVLAAFEEFVSTTKPNLLMLSASKENKNRYRLYQKIAASLSTELTEQGYVSCQAPEYRYTNTSKYFDSMAWCRRSAAHPYG